MLSNGQPLHASIERPVNAFDSTGPLCFLTVFQGKKHDAYPPFVTYKNGGVTSVSLRQRGAALAIFFASVRLGVNDCISPCS